MPILPISSRSNPAIKSIRALHDRKERARTQLFFVEGIRLVAEAVQLNAEIQTIITAPDLLKSDFARDIAHQAQTQGAQHIDVTSEVFNTFSDKSGPQGIAAVVKQRWTPLSAFSSQPSALSFLSAPYAPRPSLHTLYVALESPQDPGNIGTILRTADAVGASGVILLGQHADPYDPEAVRASMGAIFAQHLTQTTFAELLAFKVQHSLSLIGTSDKASLDYRSADYQRPLILLMGSERQGLTPDQSIACDQHVRIPMQGRSDSLNLAVATSVLLYESYNQCHPVK